MSYSNIMQNRRAFSTIELISGKSQVKKVIHSTLVRSEENTVNRSNISRNKTAQGNKFQELTHDKTHR